MKTMEKKLTQLPGCFFVPYFPKPHKEQSGAPSPDVSDLPRMYVPH
jgi:hypothetical protein